jgi:SagB-type dehydrogenase family enzyme
MSDRRTIPLSPPPSIVGIDLMEALRRRRSTREYAANETIPDETLSALLWAADGVSGPEDKRTAPSAFGGNQVKVYVATERHVLRYDASEHALTELAGKDVRATLCPDEWVGSAPLSVILTGRTDQFPEFIDTAMSLQLLQATAGCIAENLHLMAGALALGTCMVGHMHIESVRSALALDENEVPLYVMPVGYLR